MGYTIKIGEFAPHTEEGREVPNVIDVALFEAPADGSPTDNMNARWPSYSAWSNFARDTDLSHLFFDKETGLMREHPGCEPLSEAHKVKIDEAHHAHKDGPHKGRIEWLKFWVDWALQNCKNPVIVNS